jgi:hypothetical protein
MGRTEQEWLISCNPALMLDFLGSGRSDRKLRLFASACCRQVWDRLTNPYLRLAVEAAEDFADGEITEDDLTCARAAAWSATNRAGHAMAAARAAVRESPWAAAREAQRETMQQVWEKFGRSWPWGIVPEEKKTALRRQCDLLRCIFGNPFRSALLRPDWLVWNNGTIPKIAQLIYTERRFQDLPILADALEEAGCDDAEALKHCRQPGEHVRGCWVVDLILGKV